MNPGGVQRSRGRFVPTLTEVVVPVVLEPGQALASPLDGVVAEPQADALQACVALEQASVEWVEGATAAPDDRMEGPQATVGLRGGSALEATVEALLPQARVQLQAALQATADALVAQQLQAMEVQLRTQLRASVRQAMGLGLRDDS